MELPADHLSLKDLKKLYSSVFIGLLLYPSVIDNLLIVLSLINVDNWGNSLSKKILSLFSEPPTPEFKSEPFIKILFLIYV